ncbi:MAG: hypothetical protein KZQ65_09200, partial [Candidatus Thiodiazotropha sp. (ex Gloverina cf. vestifex)]|nr:hypothetical protein [Candidatus Thiodiazotropha sp. (ex Gloverina cf. vestifex)]
KLFASWGLYNDWPRMCTIIPQSMDLFRASLARGFRATLIHTPAVRVCDGAGYSSPAHGLH